METRDAHQESKSKAIHDKKNTPLFDIKLDDVKQAIDRYHANQTLTCKQKFLSCFKSNDVDVIQAISKFHKELEGINQTQLDLGSCIALYILLRSAVKCHDKPEVFRAIEPLLQCYHPHWSTLRDAYEFLSIQRKPILVSVAHTLSIIDEMEMDNKHKLELVCEILVCRTYEIFLNINKNFDDIINKNQERNLPEKKEGEAEPKLIYASLQKDKNELMKILLKNLKHMPDVAACLKYINDRNHFLKVTHDDLYSLLTHPKRAEKVYKMLEKNGYKAGAIEECIEHTHHREEEQEHYIKTRSIF